MKTTTFAFVAGLLYLAMGVMGFVPALLRPPAADAPPTTFTVFYGLLLGAFVVNALLSLLHAAVGAWGLSASRGLTSAKVYSRSAAMLFGVLAVMGLIPGMNTLFGMLPLYGHDVWLHAGSALAAAYFGWRTEEEMERRAVIGDRRARMLPVARERRLGLTDRRQLDYGAAA